MENFITYHAKYTMILVYFCTILHIYHHFLSNLGTFTIFQGQTERFCFSGSLRSRLGLAVDKQKLEINYYDPMYKNCHISASTAFRHCKIGKERAYTNYNDLP